MFSCSCLIYQRYSVGFISGGGAIQFVILLLVGIKQCLNRCFCGESVITRAQSS